MKFFRKIGSVIRLKGLTPSQRRLTFYSEGPNYWPHLESLVTGMLRESDLHICYISSSSDDPGLRISDPRLHPFLIDEGFVRNWVFENLETDVMVMTMPDLGQYQVKRSRNPVHYVYVQHSLVSLHMVYRHGAFDHFDTVFCGGPHHEIEIRAMEACYGLPPKKLVRHGYPRLDAIMRDAGQGDPSVRSGDEQHVLIAPSWGPDCLIESGIAADITRQMLEAGYRVTLRPHPQTFRYARNAIDGIIDEHGSNTRFTFESNVAGQESLKMSDIMVCDWSGAALDYAFGLNKPVLFVDVPRKINNQDYAELGIEPFEVSIREEIGAVWTPGQDLISAVRSLETKEFNAADHVYHPGNSDTSGIAYLKHLLAPSDTARNEPHTGQEQFSGHP